MSIIKKYKAKVKQIINPLPDIFTVTLSSDKKFNYLPGQFLHLALDEYDGIGQWPESRCFSMQSNPNEETIKITFAVKGNYTKRMADELQKGKEVSLKLPYGELFTQSHNKSNTVFIAGGTGITPFLSLFTHESFNEYINPSIYLGFRSKKYNIYNEDLDRMQTIRAIRTNSCNSYSPKFVRFYYQNTDGFINIKQTLYENGINSDYFISGPPLMIKSFKNFLLSNRIEENRIKTDEWE